MNESYYNNSTENITSSNHCASSLIAGDEYVSVENNLHVSTNDSYKRGMNNNRTNNKNNNNINNITKTVCSYHVMYMFQSESTLYSCLNVKELFARSRRLI